MANYRTTVILNTDIVDSTPRLSGQTQAEMSLLRRQHKQFIAETAAKHHGSAFEEEGDAYWMDFPSVAAACLSAIEMHQNLRSMQAGNQGRSYGGRYSPSGERRNGHDHEPDCPHRKGHPAR